MSRTIVNDVKSLRGQSARIQLWSLVLGIAGLLVCAVGALINPAQFFHSYLFAFVFWVGLSLGCLAIVMIHQLTAGSWGVIRRPLEAGAMNLVLMGVLFIPLAFGLAQNYSWARPELVAVDVALQHKQQYLNVPFFLIRTLIYFVIWCGLAYMLNKWSRDLDRTGNERLIVRVKKLSAAGLLLFGLTITFAMIDRVMSLEPHWYSSIYSVMVGTGSILEAFAFSVLVMFYLAQWEPIRSVITPKIFNDLGSLTFAFIMLWAYMAFSQFLLIWAGNLAEEIPWYLLRFTGGWLWIAVLILLLHFALPFALLMSRELKRNAPLLTTMAALLFLMRLVDVFWLIAPVFHQGGLQVHWLDIAAPIGIGGLWVAAYIWWLKDKPLLPLHDPRLEFEGVAEHA